MFTFVLTFDGFEVDGSAKTKQKAKHNAAQVSFVLGYKVLTH